MLIEIIKYYDSCRFCGDYLCLEIDSCKKIMQISSKTTVHINI